MHRWRLFVTSLCSGWGLRASAGVLGAQRRCRGCPRTLAKSTLPGLAVFAHPSGAHPWARAMSTHSLPIDERGQNQRGEDQEPVTTIREGKHNTTHPSRFHTRESISKDLQRAHTQAATMRSSRPVIVALALLRLQPWRPSPVLRHSHRVPPLQNYAAAKAAAAAAAGGRALPPPPPPPPASRRPHHLQAAGRALRPHHLRPRARRRPRRPWPPAWPPPPPPPPMEEEDDHDSRIFEGAARAELEALGAGAALVEARQDHVHGARQAVKNLLGASASASARRAGRCARGASSTRSWPTRTRSSRPWEATSRSVAAPPAPPAAPAPAPAPAAPAPRPRGTPAAAAPPPPAPAAPPAPPAAPAAPPAGAPADRAAALKLAAEARRRRRPPPPRQRRRRPPRRRRRRPEGRRAAAAAPSTDSSGPAAAARAQGRGTAARHAPAPAAPPAGAPPPPPPQRPELDEHMTEDADEEALKGVEAFEQAGLSADEHSKAPMPRRTRTPEGSCRPTSTCRPCSTSRWRSAAARASGGEVRAPLHLVLRAVQAGPLRFSADEHRKERRRNFQLAIDRRSARHRARAARSLLCPRASSRPREIVECGAGVQPERRRDKSSSRA